MLPLLGGGCEGSASGVWGPWGGLVMCCRKCSHLGGWEGELCFQVLPRPAEASDSVKMADGKPSGTADGKHGCKNSPGILFVKHFCREADGKAAPAPCQLVLLWIWAAPCHMGGALGALGVRWVPWGCTSNRTMAGRERTAHHMKGECLPWLTPRFPDDKQLRERDLQQIKSEGKVHYLPRGAPAMRPVAGGRAFWLVEPILLVPGGQSAPAWAAGRHGGLRDGTRLGRDPPRAWVPPVGISGRVLGPGPASDLLQCLQERLTSLSGL